METPMRTSNFFNCKIFHFFKYIIKTFTIEFFFFSLLSHCGEVFSSVYQKISSRIQDRDISGTSQDCVQGGTLAFAPLTEKVTEIWDPFTPLTFPNLHSLPPYPYSESKNTNRTISSRTGNLLFFNHLLGLRSSI